MFPKILPARRTRRGGGGDRKADATSMRRHLFDNAAVDRYRGRWVVGSALRGHCMPTCKAYSVIIANLTSRTLRYVSVS